ncbi:MAG: CHAT domain-containing protein [bacterium]
MTRIPLRDLIVLIALMFAVVSAPLAAEAVTAVGVAAENVAAPAAPAADARFRARLDAVKALVPAKRFAEMESLAVAVKADIEASANPDTLLLAEALFVIGVARTRGTTVSDERRLEPLLACLDLFDSRPDAPDTLVLTANRMVGVHLINLGRYADARRHLEAALEIARRHEEWRAPLGSEIQYFIGRAMSDAAENDSANAVLREALAARRGLALPHDPLVARIYGTLGLTYGRIGKPELAEEAFADAIHWVESQEGPDGPALAYPLSEAAEFAFVRGDYARVIDHYQRIYDILSKAAPSDPNCLIAEASIAQAMLALGDIEGARDRFERLTPQLEALYGANNPQALNCWLVLAEAHFQLGDSLRALELNRKVSAVLDADSSMAKDVLLLSALVNEAQILSRIAPSDSALELAKRVERTNGWDASTQPSFTLSALSAQLSIYARREMWDEADRADASLQEGLNRLALAGGSDADIAWVARSEAAALRGRHDDAVRLAAHGARFVRERLVQNIRCLSDRQSLLFASTVSEPLDQLLRVGALADSASIRVCWDEVVRKRGIVRAEISRRRRPPRADADSSLALAHAAWVADQARLARFEVSLGTSYRDGATDSTRAALRAQADESERRLVRRYPGSESLDNPSVVGLDSALARLASDAALVGFVRAPDAKGEVRLVAFVARGGSPRLRSLDLGSVAGLEADIAEWRAELGSPNSRVRSEEACRALGARVRERVWDPIAAATRGASALYFVPEAPVDGLPWGALPAGDGEYLVETGAVVHVLDAEREIVPEAGAPSGVGLFALGAIDYDRAESDTVAAVDQVATLFRGIASECDSAATRRLAPLPATDGEVRDVEAAWSGGPESFGPITRLTGSNATEGGFKSLASGHQVLHVATHGVTLGDACGDSTQGLRGVGGVEPVAPGAPKRSVRPAKSARPSPWLGRQVFLALADANHARDGGARDENEGLLTAEEVTTLDLRGVDWVVLSACHSAAGEAWSGQGVLGMQRAFHLAGARTVIASQWSVADESTREWMRALYEARSRGALRAANATTAASRTVLDARRESGRSTHPFYWAAFTASGE